MTARSTPPKATPAGRKLLKHYLKVQQFEGDLAGEMEISRNKGFTSLPIGINADSLALWFLEVMSPFLMEERVLLDIQVNDQEQTHQLLKDGDVIGCISTKDQPMQACRIQYIGQMNYRLVASPQFAERWFPTGLTSV